MPNLPIFLIIQLKAGYPIMYHQTLFFHPSPTVQPQKILQFLNNYMNIHRLGIEMNWSSPPKNGQIRID